MFATLKTMKFSNAFLAAALFVVGMALYATSFGNAMFWDDDDFILRNRYIQDVQYLPQLFTENVIAGSGLVSDYWRPVLLLVFSAEWYAWGDAPAGWHAVNAAFHAANGVLLFFLLLWVFRWLGASGKDEPKRPHTYMQAAASGVALLFLVHPVQVEAVAYVNSLGDSLSTFFLLASLLLYTEYLTQLRSGYYAAAVALYPLALMSKETAIVLPGLALVADALFVLPSAQLSAVRRWARGAVGRMAPFAVLAAAYVAARVTVLNFKNSLNLYNQATAYTESIWIRLLTFCKVLWEYVQLLVWPRVLHMERHMESATSLFDLQVLLGAGVVLVLSIIAVRVWCRGSRLPVFGLLWFLIALAPTSNIAVPINGVLYEHWLYVPLIGMGVFVAGLALQLGDYWRDWTYGSNRTNKTYRTNNTNRTYAVLWVGGLVVVALCARSVVRIREWADPVRFYTQTVQYAPQSYRILNNLAMELADRGDLAESIPYYERAVALDPNNPVAQYNLGNTYAALGKLDEALTQYERSVAVDPAFVYVYRPLIGLHLQQGHGARVRELLAQYARLRGGLEPDLREVADRLEKQS